MKSCLGKILRVNLTTGNIKWEDIPGDVRKSFVGGRGIGINYLFCELAPGVDPLGPENKLILVNGILAGTNAQGCARWLAMTKSPLTGGIGRACCGGSFGAYLKFAGLEAIIIEGKASQPVYLFIDGYGAELRAAQELWGLNTQKTQEQLQAKHPGRLETACIGPAGEKLVRYATITNGRRTASRCGVGTVMGAKNLKAVSIQADPALTMHSPDTFKELVRQQVDILKNHPRRQSMSRAGTTVITQNVNTLGVYPVKNFQEGCLQGWEVLGSEAFQKIRIKNAGCYSCMTRCGQVHEVKEGPYSGATSEGPEYETIWAFGGLLANTELGSTVVADDLCDNLGLDTISTGVAISFAFELYQRGIITQEDTGGLELTWGNHQAMLELVAQIGQRKGLGNLLAEGVKRAAEALNRGAEEYAMHVKGLEFGGYDPRGIKGYGLSYATSNIGASHMYGRPREELYGQADRFTEEGKGNFIANAQRQLATDETMILCCFGNSGMTNQLMGDLMKAATGIEELADPAYLELVGERILCMERAFNVREGFTRQDDQLPKRFRQEALQNAGPSTGMVIKNLDGLLDEYYHALGYTREGIPTRGKLEQLGLGWVKLDIAEVKS
ncbi:MAG: aldehyde ferredoxin oxidoreductase family protein [Carboxydocellales bacterium]